MTPKYLKMSQKCQFRQYATTRIILIAPSFVSESDVVADDSGILHHQRKNHEINLVSITLPSCLIMSFGEPSVCLFVSDITWSLETFQPPNSLVDRSCRGGAAPELIDGEVVDNVNNNKRSLLINILGKSQLMFVRALEEEVFCRAMTWQGML
ncbi:hypothetical protein M8J77_008268 [Diaphorina citri]|nr:hypothetical protein M8J77_008268 [Diaphorina citri]